jgi:hypothetical protein
MFSLAKVAWISTTPSVRPQPSDALRRPTARPEFLLLRLCLSVVYWLMNVLVEFEERINIDLDLTLVESGSLNTACHVWVLSEGGFNPTIDLLDRAVAKLQGGDAEQGGLFDAASIMRNE